MEYAVEERDFLINEADARKDIEIRDNLSFWRLCMTVIVLLSMIALVRDMTALLIFGISSFVGLSVIYFYSRRQLTSERNLLWPYAAASLARQRRLDVGATFTSDEMREFIKAQREKWKAAKA